MTVYNLTDQDTALYLTVAFAIQDPEKHRYLFLAEEANSRGFISETFIGEDADEDAYIELFFDYVMRGQRMDRTVDDA